MRRPALVLWLVAACLAAAPLAAVEELTFDLIFETAVGGRTAQLLGWSPDGRTLLYQWDEAGDGSAAALVRLDAASGQATTVVTLAELGRLAQAEDGKLEPGDVQWSPTGDALLLAAKNDLYLYSLTGKTLKRLTDDEDEEKIPQFSPDGSQLAFVRDFDLHVLDLATGKERALTRDGKKNEILNGINDWVYWEEIWNRREAGFWWSPDGKRIAYYRFDESPVAVYPLVDAAPVYPEVTWQKYPKAGEPNPKVKVGVFDLASHATTWMETGGDDVYLARVDWTPAGDAVAIQRLNRDQTRLELLRCGITDGACSTLHTETWKTWVNLGDDFRFLPDGRFLWGSEKSGWRRLYLHDRDGREIRALSPEGWAVTSLDGVSKSGEWAMVTVFATSGLGAAERKVARLGVAQERWEILTPEAGMHDAQVAEATGYWVHGRMDGSHPKRSEVMRGLPKPLPLPSTAPRFDPAALPQWEIFTIPGLEGSQLPARLLKPAGFDPTRRYPVIVYHYGGPGSQVVTNAWNVRGLWHQWMASKGYVVFSVDNLSSIFFGKAGEDRDHRRFGEVNLAGQLAAVDHLKTLLWVDASRIGLWGWSGGGANTLYCLLSRPGVWRAGVAGAPVTDWKLYDSIWTERYLDTPQDNAEGYRLSSPVTHAASLKDKLLIVHGTGDDNVHPQNTVVMSDAFIRAGVPFEQGIYPNQKHGFHGPSSKHFYAKMTEFFERHLQAIEIESVEVVRGE
jgi:dipeptidyl-peptidase-4